MQIIEGRVFIEWQELLSVGIPDGTIRAAQQRESSGWTFIADPSDARKVLIAFHTLKEKYKNMIRLRLGDPIEAAKSTILENYMVATTHDIDFLQNYRLRDGRKLPTATLSEYINACKVLHFLCKYSSKADAKSLGFSDLRAFWCAVSAYIMKSKVVLPKDRNKLQSKIELYKLKGPASVISSKFCNKNSAKVTNEVSAALLLELIGHHNQFEDVFVAQKYNQWAATSGYKTITPATVGNYRHRHEMEVTASRLGSSVWRNAFDKSVHQVRPSSPLLLINSDDNVLDLYFVKETQNKKGHKTTDYYHRVTLMVVMDSYNDYPLGYAIGETQTIELVKEAFLNAIHHVRELTGGQHLWHQIKADSWGLASLRPWYEKQATFTPPRTGNARGKVIEQAFGNNWHRLLRQYPNYAGHNITAKSQLNPDALQRNKKDFPSLDQAPAVVADFINRLRTQVSQKSQLTRQEMWLAAWNKALPEKKRELGDLERLMIFGKRHNFTNTITKDGLIVTLGGERVMYEVRNDDFKKHVGKTLNIAYDPYDATSIAAFSDDGATQILCPVYEKYKMAIADMAAGDRIRLNVMLGEKRENSQWVLNAQTERRALLQRHRIDAESLLQAGVLVKELKQDAEQTYALAQFNTDNADDVFDDMDLPEPIRFNDEDTYED